MILHRKIRTGEKHVPWSAVFMLATMWFTWGFNIFAGGVALTFTIRKYVNNPQIISLVMTFAGILMLGPIISYVSDQVWTRAGRRRPFLIIAWLGGFLAMLSFAFLPKIAGVVNHVLVAVGLQPVGELLILAVVVACYTKMWDGAAPLEPLFLECVPPQQRGRFWAMRGMLFSLAVMMFYQILWPVYDRNIDMLAWLGHAGVLYMYGERAIYLLAAGLFFFTGIFVVFCVEETRMPQAPNMQPADFLRSDNSAELVGVQDVKQLVKLFWVISIVVGLIVSLLGSLSVRSVIAMIAILVVALFLERLILLSRPLIWFFSRPAIGRFIWSFLRDVSLKKENYPYYIVLIIPGIETMIWGNFNALMQNDQFQYTKQAQANWAFPMQIMSIFILPVFAGWYSDVRCNIRWWQRMLMLLLSAASFVAMLRVLKIYSPEDIRQLPSFLILSVITVLAALSMVMLYIPMVETMLDIVGREHARAWVSLLTVVKSMITVALLYVVIQRSLDQVPPILIWMVFSVVGTTLGALMDTFIGPMIYDYMPRSQMGTINSGKGIIESFVKFCAANLGAWWIVFFSLHIHKPAHVKYDYTSMYILQFLLFIPAIAAKLYFIRLITRGKMKKWGTMEVEAPEEAVIEEKLAHLAGAGAAAE